MFADATTDTVCEAEAGNGVAVVVVAAAAVVCAGQTPDCTRYDCRTAVDDWRR